MSFRISPPPPRPPPPTPAQPKPAAPPPESVQPQRPSPSRDGFDAPHPTRVNLGSPAPAVPRAPTAAATHRPGTPSTERSGDTNVNCMDQAYTYLQAHPELAANAQVVFLQDMRNADGNNAGHVVLQLPPVEVNRPSLLA